MGGTGKREKMGGRKGGKGIGIGIGVGVGKILLIFFFGEGKRLLT